MAVYGISIQPYTNNLLVCWGAEQTVQVFNDKSAWLYDADMKIPHDNLHFGPNEVGCDSNGSFSVTGILDDRIQLFDCSGRRIRVVSPFDFGPEAICYVNRRFTSSASANLLLVCRPNAGRVVIWDSNGKQQISDINIHGSTRGICVDLNGYVYVSCFNCISKDGLHEPIKVYDLRKNALVQTLPIGVFQLTNPSGLCVDDTNNLMVLDESGIHICSCD